MLIVPIEIIASQLSVACALELLTTFVRNNFIDMTKYQCNMYQIINQLRM